MSTDHLPRRLPSAHSAVVGLVCAALLVLGCGGPAVAAGLVPAAAPPAAGPDDGPLSVDPLDGAGVLVDPAVPVPPAVTAQSWLVADLDNGDVLAASNAHQPLAPASTIKLLTLLALAPDLDPEATYTATAADAAADGSKVGLAPGSVYTVDDLLHGLMLASGNDAAQALASLSGGMADATTEMQELADDLGADDTVVGNTSGLDAPGQATSAYDLALIGRALLRQPELAALVTTTRYAFPGAGTTFGPERPRFEIANHNRLLTQYEGALGLKNGYTDAARGSFVAGVERDGRRYVVTLMKAEGVTWRLSRDLLDWALAGGADGTPVGTLDGPAPGPEAESAAQAVDGELGSDPEPGDEPALATAGAAGPPALATPVVAVLLLLAVSVVALRVRAVRRRRRRRMRRRAVERV